MRVPEKARRWRGSLGTGVAGSCEWSSVGVENEAWDLRKTSQHAKALNLNYYIMTDY